jgi:hypothetical protein
VIEATPAFALIRATNLFSRTHQRISASRFCNLDLAIAAMIRGRASFLQSLALSMGRCNTGLQFTSWSFKAQSFPWALIELQRYFVEVGLGIAEQVGFLWEVLS